MCKSLNEIDDEILAILEPENIESNVSESMGIMESVHEILAEITLKLENMRLEDFWSFERGDNKILNTKLPKLEFLVLNGNPLEQQSFMTSLTFRFTKIKP